MAVAALVARLILAAVFGLAGVTKLLDRGGTRTTIVEFGAPEGLATPAALLVPAVELAAVGLLLPSGGATPGLAVAVVLLLVFSAAIGVNLARGRAPECHCFGQLHSAPAGWRMLARNGLLLAIAAAAVAGGVGHPQLSAVAWVGHLDAAQAIGLASAAAMVVLVGLGGVALLSLVRSYGRVLIRLDRLERALADAGIDVDVDEPEGPAIGLEPGTAAPAGLDDLLAHGRPVLLLFTSPRCGPCKELLPRAASWQHEHADVLTVAFAMDGAPSEIDAETVTFGLQHVLDDRDHALYDAFHVNGTPSAVLISEDGSVASWVAAGSDSIVRLAEAAGEPSAPELGLPIGAEVPPLELPGLDGEAVALEALRGRETVLLFWDPDCGFCRAMRDDLRRWDDASTAGDPYLVVVSSGDAQRTKADDFRSLVLLDVGSAAGSLFGAGGTPMAVLLGEDGRVASHVAAGADAVMALANGARGLRLSGTVGPLAEDVAQTAAAQV